MRVLGVTLCDPTDAAKPATAYFALMRFVLPNALYHMQVWGLLCGEAVWAEVDEAFTRFCEAVCPLDQHSTSVLT